MDYTEIQKKLFKVQENEYGNEYKNHLLDQYKLYVESADKISDRRQKTNDFFLTINTALLALFSYITIKAENDLSFMIVLASIAGLLICYFWYRIIRAYKDMNTGKFKVIHAIEDKLPLALYDVEWDVLGRGKNPELYLPFTHIEVNIPWIFIALYFIVFVGNIPWDKIMEIIRGLF